MQASILVRLQRLSLWLWLRILQVLARGRDPCRSRDPRGAATATLKGRLQTPALQMTLKPSALQIGNTPALQMGDTPALKAQQMLMVKSSALELQTLKSPALQMMKLTTFFRSWHLRGRTNVREADNTEASMP